jgi:hypothetical protein
MKNCFVLKKIRNVNFLIALSLVLIIAFHGFANFYWLSFDGLPHGGDTGGHLKIAFLLQKDVCSLWREKGDILSFVIGLGSLSPTTEREPWGPVLYWAAVLFNGVQCKDFFFNARFLTNLFFLVVLVFWTFLSGAQIFDKQTGVLAAFLVSFFPVCYGYSRQFEFEFSMIAFVALTFYVLISGWYKKTVLTTICASVLIGAGFLIKPQFLFFVAFPFLYALYREYLEKRSFVRLCGRATVIMAISGALALSYYAKELETFIRSAYDHFFAVYPFFSGSSSYIPYRPDMSEITSFKSLVFYTVALVQHIRMPLAVLFVLSLWHLFRTSHISRFLLFGSVFFPYMIYTLISVKWMRYIMPALFFVALVSAWGVIRIKRRILRVSVVLAIILYCFGLFFYSSFYKEKEISDNGAFFFRPDYGHNDTHRPIPKESNIMKDPEIARIRSLLREHGSVTIGTSNWIADTGMYIGFLDELCKEFANDPGLDHFQFEYIKPDAIGFSGDYFYAHSADIKKNASRYSHYTVISQPADTEVLLRRDVAHALLNGKTGK